MIKVDIKDDGSIHVHIENSDSEPLDADVFRTPDVTSPRLDVAWFSPPCEFYSKGPRPTAEPEIDTTTKDHS